MKRKKRLAALTLALCLALTGLAPGAVAVTVYGYQEGFAQAVENGKWGFAGGDGSVAIPLQYDSVVSFSLGMAAVNLNGRLGVIRPDGAYLIPPEYDTLMPAGFGLYIAQKGNRWGVVSVLPYLNEEGKKTNEVYPITYENVELGTSGGLDALILTAGGGSRTIVPLFRLPGILQSLGVEGSQFPLTRGRLPAFTDVRGRDWYSMWVDIAYNTGIMSGTGNNAFEPNREVTVAEALQMAANMDSRFKGDTFHTTAHVSTPWYIEAVDYCLASGTITAGQFDDYERQITRRELAQVFGATSLARSLPDRNSLVRVMAAVGDVSGRDEGAQAIYGLYVKGILTGVDANLSFRPGDLVTRAEAAALAARLARPEQRMDLF
ncbi:WG repeat-containing protein [Vermiculatibacterium agrestimuris]|uniref:WG repeat-containing protein n=1 Tax=Vermiculatibacterium agrestimuris TaxID=2941519 RepID=UPI0020425E78|nr:WG repeat-containing protein [Vermiculatibacterium agrestimuris]